MNGPEHFRMAEKLLVSCQLQAVATDDGTEVYPTGKKELAALVAAQVHATLAQAAATVQEAVSLYTDGSDDLVAWAKALAAAPAVDR